MQLTLANYPALALDAEAIDRALDLHAPEDGVLSVYLNVEPAHMEREGFEAALLDLWKPLRQQVRNTAAEQRVEEEIARVNEYVRSWEEPPGRSVAMFSCAPLDAFIPIALEVPVIDGAHFGPRPYLVPLIGALDEYERYCVTLVDKERARILTVWLGEIRDRIEIEDVVPGRSAAGGWSQARYARHREWHVHEHMRHVAERLWSLDRRERFHRLIIGGPDEALAALKDALPRSLKEKVVAEFAGEMFATDADIVARVRDIETQIERAGERALVEEILERAPKGELAALGWDDTFTALVEGRVHRLALVEGLTAEGFECPEGHAVVRERADRCPYCDAPMRPVADLAARAVRMALATGARIEFVRGDAAELLRPHGAGAILRFQ
ncbi:MAG TPA: Vms1/Ankzf1 family peptidyl-tRNA hydrolase [Dehalococcoidia bacterium]|nr:Vms1/Ankzf1 family peptidyl-tRNA hydrolase [Dehalococcoidia bacterium]